MKKVSSVCIFLCAFYSYSCLAQNQHILLSDMDADLVGTNGSTVVNREDTLIDVAVNYHLGYNMIRSANPDVDSWLPDDGSKVLLPFSVLLPDVPREGIVINTPEMRLYFYHQDKEGQNIVSVFPISVGRRDWATPITETRITLRVEDPPWYPPESIRAEHAERGDSLPRIVPAGPDNPLGHHLLGLDIPSYFIHGTNKRFGIGMQVTHGCIRMYPEHIEELFNLAPVNTPVVIINQSYKLGWRDDELYLEVHHPLELDGVTQENSRPDIMTSLTNIVESMPEMLINWDKVDEAINKATGVPVMVGKQPHSLSEFDFYQEYNEE
ncbi:MAG: L,D-transpeptidase family protein [Porticoccus sp.]|nr:L,D-transpeptidase family protein [Porticoccus sp.]